MRRRILVLFALFLATACIAPAHGTKKHFVGTVEKINADSIVVKSTQGTSVEVKIVRTTGFLKSGQSAKLQDLTVGDRVVIHATPKGDTLEADEVKFGRAPATAKKTSQP